jgi:hypothetical protein
MRALAPIFAAIAALALAACGQQASTPAEGGGAPVQQAGGPPTNAPAWVRGQWKTLPEWTTIANVSGGGIVMFSPRSIARDANTGTADVMVQVVFKEPRRLQSEDAKTITTTSYFKERALYRFHCESRLFMVAGRELLGDGDKVINTVNDPAQWRGVDTSGPAIVLEGPTCKSA